MTRSWHVFAQAALILAGQLIVPPLADLLDPRYHDIIHGVFAFAQGVVAWWAHGLDQNGKPLPPAN